MSTSPLFRLVLCLVLVSVLAVSESLAQGSLSYELDASWPKPLPDKWITGQLGGVCVDAHDHVAVVNRRDITDEELETSLQAPPILLFDRGGALVASFGDAATVPASIHGCTFDRENNLWVAGNDDAVVQKYSHEGTLLLQIGTRGRFDSSDGTLEGTANNSSRDRLFAPAGVAIDPANGDVYVADGYGNKRVAVFDRNGRFLRQWGAKATAAEAAAGRPGVFANVVHCVAISNAGLVYVCDRQGDRVQVFDKMGGFIRNIWIRTGTPTLPDPRGTAWWVAFSTDPAQKYLYVMNGRNEAVHVLDHDSGKILSTFGRPGHQGGNFTHGHTMAVDSAGNIYVAETNWGRRVQRFTPVAAAAQGGAAAKADEAAVKDLVARYNAARDEQNASALETLFTGSADQLVSSGEWRRGRDALVRGMLQSSRTSPGDRTITVETVRFLGPDVALADARYEIAGAGGAEPRRMWSTFFMLRTPDGWRIAAIRNMLPAR